MSITIYGIRNCDTMRKARAWLDEHGVDFQFHDYKVSGVDRKLLETWCGELGWEALLNRKGSTFRKLADADKQGLVESKAIRLMMAQPSLIKRPVMDADGRLLAGFDSEQYSKVFRTSKRGR
jgi:arsenate reductase